MDKHEFQKLLHGSATDGTLLTPKHNPNSLTASFSDYRTVLSTELASNLVNFIDTGDFSVSQYHNTKYQTSPLYFVITPNSASQFSVPASGVAAYSTLCSSGIDKLVVVSGSKIGWHIFGEDSAVIQLKINNGDLKFKGNLS